MKIFKLILFILAFLELGVLSYSSFLITGPLSALLTGGLSLLSLGFAVNTIEELK